MKKQAAVSQGPSQRQLRVGELVRHALAQMIMRGDLIDDAFKGQIITVPEVRMEDTWVWSKCAGPLCRTPPEVR